MWFVWKHLRDSPTRFSTSTCFHHSNLSGTLTNGLEYFRFWLRFRRVIQMLVLKNWLPRVSYTRGVKQKCYSRNFSKMQNVALYYSRIRTHMYFCATVPLKACVKVLRNGCMTVTPGSQHVASPGSHTPGRLALHCMIPRRGRWTRWGIIPR